MTPNLKPGKLSLKILIILFFSIQQVGENYTVVAPLLTVYNTLLYQSSTVNTALSVTRSIVTWWTTVWFVQDIMTVWITNLVVMVTLAALLHANKQMGVGNYTVLPVGDHLNVMDWIVILYLHASANIPNGLKDKHLKRFNNPGCFQFFHDLNPAKEMIGSNSILTQIFLDLMLFRYFVN